MVVAAFESLVDNRTIGAPPPSRLFAPEMKDLLRFGDLSFHLSVSIVVQWFTAISSPLAVPLNFRRIVLNFIGLGDVVRTACYPVWHGSSLAL